jgi:hypothetical protein
MICLHACYYYGRKEDEENLWEGPEWQETPSCSMCTGAFKMTTEFQTQTLYPKVQLTTSLFPQVSLVHTLNDIFEFHLILFLKPN